MSRPVGVGTGLFAGWFLSGLLLGGTTFVSALLNALLVGAVGFGVSFFLETRRDRGE